MRSKRQSETSRINGAKSRAAAFSAIADNSKGYATALRTDIHLTRTYRLRGGNILNENKISQNEPESPGISPLDTTKATPGISTEPEEPETVGQVPDLPNAEETKIPKAS